MKTHSKERLGRLRGLSSSQATYLITILNKPYTDGQSFMLITRTSRARHGGAAGRIL